ncbi:hypothetical protein ACFCVU_19130 [Peribacillus butanolivorans]|uniref:hypothetical protein n=1 Tax=Peribacillus butanolivorans TaxID=421767 RepID=UPI0035D695E9
MSGIINEQLKKSWEQIQMYEINFTQAKDAILSEYELNLYKEEKEDYPLSRPLPKQVPVSSFHNYMQ